MNDKEKSPAAGQELKTGGKGNYFSKLYQVLEILKAEHKLTAIGFNREIKFNDARKAISVLRKQGYPIMDIRLSDHRKAYYLPQNWEAIMRAETETGNKQLKLF
ncbi:MAG: hypothetical protein LBL13_06615, partial [Bacteroidales bacterium]|nr:hypothetical protein [Bacteroidales bacterium]